MPDLSESVLFPHGRFFFLAFDIVTVYLYIFFVQ